MSDKEPELRIDLDASYIPNRGSPTVNLEMRSEAMVPRTELGCKLLSIRERSLDGSAIAAVLLTEQEIAVADRAEAWRLEAERLAELVEAQQQVIATLREHMKDNNECSSRLRASTEHYAQVCARYQEEIAMLREDNARLTRHHPRRIAVDAIAR